MGAGGRERAADNDSTEEGVDGDGDSADAPDTDSGTDERDAA